MRVFFFNDTATTEIYTLSLHDALPIFSQLGVADLPQGRELRPRPDRAGHEPGTIRRGVRGRHLAGDARRSGVEDRKSTRLNSSHANISYAVFCLKKKQYTDSLE